MSSDRQQEIAPGKGALQCLVCGRDFRDPRAAGKCVAGGMVCVHDESGRDEEMNQESTDCEMVHDNRVSPEL